MAPWPAFLLPLLLPLLFLGPALAGSGPSFHSSDAGSSPGVALPQNTSYAPCSFLNFTTIHQLTLTGGPWNASAEANITHWSSVISGWWNETCVLPAFASMVQAHIRTPQNFSYGGGNDGVYTAHTNLSAAFGANWMDVTATGCSTHQESWMGTIKNGTVGATVVGPTFYSGVCIYTGYQPGPTGTSATQWLLLLGTVSAVAFTAGIVGALLVRRRGQRPPRSPSSEGEEGRTYDRSEPTPTDSPEAATPTMNAAVNVGSSRESS